MSRDAIFRLASMSKPITGVAVLMLVEEGRIRLTDPVWRYIPEFKEPKVAIAPPVGPRAGDSGEVPYDLVPAEREMTIWHLIAPKKLYGPGTVSRVSSRDRIAWAADS